MTLPRPLLTAWPRLARRLRAARRPLLLSDFDGTLAPIRRYFHQARLPKATRRLLERIAAGEAVVGVVSGRGVADLEARVGLRGIWYIGSHGYELREPRGRFRWLATPAERRRIQRAARWLAPRLRGLSGVLLDAKPASVAVHYRAAGAAAARAAEPVVRELVARYRGLRLLRGRKVWEVLPEGPGNKWAAVRYVLKRETAGREGAKDFIVYLGDDIGDESVFKNMKGISVVVGSSSYTAARYALRSPGEVRKFLKQWLKTRP
ncbi:MAG TPA: trehalose-phosphatase [Candidatus Acidoferrales bacterium]|nr:trehalose-phosphatase [Candidatus Acidoferrales bacterium]